MTARKPLAGQTGAFPPSKLRNYHRNPRKGNVDSVVASLKAHGQYRPITANIGTHTGRPNEVLAGNHTLKAFRKLAADQPDDARWNAILVHWVDVDEDQAKRIVLADNRTSEKGTYDNKALADLLSDVSHDLTGLGYTAEDLDAISATSLGADIEVDLGLDDDDEPPAESAGRGNPVISYDIVFDTDEQKLVWTDFVNWLRRTLPDLTPAERITRYIEEHAA
ncbi:ParB N-terminal domain-containing protein [Mycobacteroides abscessus]